MADVKPIVLKSTGELQQIQTGDTLGIANGGTGATTASGARTALGLAIGSQIQGWDADLDALAALASTGQVVRTGSGTFALRSLAAPAAGFTITNSDGVSGNPTFALSDDLAAVEGLSSNGLAARTAANTWTTRTIAGTAGRTVLTNGDGVAGNPTIDLATVSNGGGGTAYKFTVDSYGRVSGYSALVAGDLTPLLNATYAPIASPTFTGTVTLPGDPASALQAATKQYVDAVAAGGSPPWMSVRAVSTTNITLSGTQTIDGVSIVAADRVLVAGQTTASANGIYACAAGSWTRVTDADAAGEFNPGRQVFVNEGTSFGDSVWAFTNNANPTLGTTSLVFTQINALGQIAAGAGMTKTGNTLDVGTASSARIVVNADNIDLATVTDSGSGTFLKLTRDSYGRVTGTQAVGAADISPLLDSDLTALANTATTGLYVVTAVGSSVTRQLTAPAAGITISNNTGVGGDPTFALANDLAALEGLGSTGFAARTAADTWAQRTMTGATRIVVTNGDGVSGNPTFDLQSGVVTPGTYQSVTVDTYGRVTAGTTSSSSANVDNFTNGEASAIAIGRAVYVSASDTVRLAVANAAGTTKVVGLVQAVSINSAAAGSIAFSGIVSATTGQWDAVTGQTGGLTFGATYYLDNTTAGKITSTAPASGYVVVVGVAMSTTKLALGIQPPIQL